jgi:hypothetical protein
MSRAELVLIGLAGRGQVFDVGGATNRRRLTVSTLERIKLLGIYSDGRIPSPKELRELARQGVGGTLTATGSQTRSGKRVESLDTLADIATDGLAGIPQIHMTALEWAILGIPVAHDRLFRKLHRIGLTARSERRSTWPDRLRRKRCQCGRMPADDYLPDLVTLALLELNQPELFSTHARRATWFGLSVQHWKATMRQPYSILRDRSMSWFDLAIDHIERQLRRRSRIDREGKI